MYTSVFMMYEEHGYTQFNIKLNYMGRQCEEHVKRFAEWCGGVAVYLEGKG